MLKKFSKYIFVLLFFGITYLTTGIIASASADYCGGYGLCRKLTTICTNGDTACKQGSPGCVCETKTSEAKISCVMRGYNLCEMSNPGGLGDCADFCSYIVDGGGSGGGGGAPNPTSPPPSCTNNFNRSYNQCGGSCNGTTYGSNQSVSVTEYKNSCNGSLSYSCSLNSTCSSGCNSSTGTCNSAPPPPAPTSPPPGGGGGSFSCTIGTTSTAGQGSCVNSGDYCVYIPVSYSGASGTSDQSWNFGNGTGYNNSTSYTYRNYTRGSSNQSYTITLTATNNGRSASCNRTITVPGTSSGGPAPTSPPPSGGGACTIGKACFCSGTSAGSCGDCNGGWCNGGQCSTCSASGGGGSNPPPSGGGACTIGKACFCSGTSAGSCGDCNGGWCNGGQCSTCSASGGGGSNPPPPPPPPSSPPGSITGYVEDDFGNSLSGARVCAYATGGGGYYTGSLSNSAGISTISNLPSTNEYGGPQTYTLNVCSPPDGFGYNFVYVQPASGSWTNVPVGSGRSFIIRKPQPTATRTPTPTRTPTLIPTPQRGTLTFSGRIRKYDPNTDSCSESSQLDATLQVFNNVDITQPWATIYSVNGQFSISQPASTGIYNVVINRPSNDYVLHAVKRGSTWETFNNPTGEYSLGNISGSPTLIIDFCMRERSESPWFMTSIGNIRQGVIHNPVPLAANGTYYFRDSLDAPIFYNSAGTFIKGNASLKWIAEKESEKNTPTTNGSASFSFYKNRAEKIGRLNTISESDFHLNSGNISPENGWVHRVKGSIYINEPLNISSSEDKRIVLLADENIYINNTINLLNPNILLILAAQGNIEIGASVGSNPAPSAASAAPHITAILSAENNIVIKSNSQNCPTGDKQLVVSGTLIANAGRPFGKAGSGKLQLERSLCDSNDTYPVLFVKPKLSFITLLTNFYKVSSTNWTEVEP